MTVGPAEEFLSVDEHAGGRRRVGRGTPRGILAVVAAWLGAVLFFGAAVAPAAVAVSPSPAEAGALVGRLLPVLFVSGIVVGLVLIVAAARLGTGRTLIRRSLAIAGVVMVATCGLAQLWVAPEIARVRAGAGVLDSLPPDDPIRREFGRLHGMSVALLGIAWLGAVTAVAIGSVASGRRG
jgi:hypothetical protein